MCGRYTLHRLDHFLQAFFRNLHEQLRQHQFKPRFNIAPTNDVPVIRQSKGKAELVLMRWGLIPSWAKDPAIGSRMINARAETLAEKPAFRTALLRRRCLVPVDGFYEWKKLGKTKQPYYIRMKDNQPFALAGLWDYWEDPTHHLESFTIITTTPNELLASLHDRMPVIIAPESYSRWLDTRQDASDLLGSYDAKQMEILPVSTRVNTPQYDDQTLIEPAPMQGLFQ